MLVQQFRFAESTRQSSDGQPLWVVDPADISDRKETRDSKNKHTIAGGILPDNGDTGPATRYEDILSTNGVRAPVITFDEQRREAYRYMGDGPLPDLDEIPAALARMEPPSTRRTWPMRWKTTPGTWPNTRKRRAWSKTKTQGIRQQSGTHRRGPLATCPGRQGEDRRGVI